MADPKMSGVELGGRLIGLEAFVLALAAEALQVKGDDEVAAIFAHVKTIAQSLVDAITPEAGPLSPVIKQLEEHAMVYVEQYIDSITRQRRKAIGGPYTK